MKLKQISLLVLCACATNVAFSAEKKSEEKKKPVNSTTLYGSLKYTMTFIDKKKDDNSATFDPDFKRGNANFGIKGNELIGNGIEAGFDISLEAKVPKSDKKDDKKGGKKDDPNADVEFAQLKDAHLYLSGDFGKITLGSTKTAFDAFKATTDSHSGAIGLEKTKYGVRYDKTIKLADSQEISIGASANLTPSTEKDAKRSFDAGFGYKHGDRDIEAKVAYLHLSTGRLKAKINDLTTTDVFSAGVSLPVYRSEDKKISLKVAGNYQHHRGLGHYFSIASTADVFNHRVKAGYETLHYPGRDNWQNLNASYRFKYEFDKLSNAELKASYSLEQQTNKDDKHGIKFEAAYKHGFSKRTSAELKATYGREYQKNWRDNYALKLEVQHKF